MVPPGSSNRQPLPVAVRVPWCYCIAMSRAVTVLLAALGGATLGATTACGSEEPPAPAPSVGPTPCTGDACPCPDDGTRCDGTCVDTTSDAEHCGGCGTACALGERCEGGACVCPGATDFDTDANHCGGCGQACLPAHRCEGGTCVCEAGPVTFSGDVQPIFDTHCTASACHDGTQPKGQLDLRAGVSHGALVDVIAFQTGTSCPATPRVSPGDPGGSYLVAKVVGQGACFGAQMPPDEPLEAAAIESIITWVCNGAPSD